MNEADRRRLHDEEGKYAFRPKPDEKRDCGSPRAAQRRAVEMAAKNLDYYEDYWDFEALAVHYFREIAWGGDYGTPEFQWTRTDDDEPVDYKLYIRGLCRARWAAAFDERPWRASEH